MKLRGRSPAEDPDVCLNEGGGPLGFLNLTRALERPLGG